ncbi:hypothetical protein GF352_00200 [archaeon]|nr:hypothetical protein [archaeon]
MGILKRLFSRGSEDDYVEKPEFVNLTVNDLKKQVKSSLKRVNDLGDKDYAAPVIDLLSKLKSIINGLMSRELNSDYNKALLIGANNARKRVNDQLKPLLDIKKPVDLQSVNAFIEDSEKLLERAQEVSAQSRHAQVIFRDDMNKLGAVFDDLDVEVNDMKEAVSERNEQLDSFKQLVDEVKHYEEALKKLEKIKQEEFETRKKISSNERDKAFLASEISQIKSLDSYAEQSSSKAKLEQVKKKKLELESTMRNLVSKFSRLVRKVFRGDLFVNEFLANPLVYVSKKEGEFNKRMSTLIDKINSDSVKVSSKTKKKYLKVLTSDKMSDCIDAYSDLLKKEKSLKKTDFSILKRSEAFERRLMNLNTEVNELVKKLDTFKDRVKSQEREVEALKAKVESIASECYTESVRIVS